MPNYPYRTLGIPLDLDNWEALNRNFEDIGTDIQKQQSQINQLVVDGDSSPEAAQARVGVEGTAYTTLKDRIDSENEFLKSNIEELTSYTNNRLDQIGSASPKDTYATVSELTAAFPTGNTNIYIVTADGNWYYWNESAWTAGGVYQSVGIASKSVGVKEITDGSIAPAVTSFVSNGKNKFENVYLENIGISGASNAGTVSQNNGRLLAVAKVEPGKTYTITKSEAGELFRFAGSPTFPKIGDVLTNYLNDPVVDTKTTHTFTMGANDRYLIIFLSTSLVKPKWIQIEEGTIRTSYEPNKQALTLDNKSVDLLALKGSGRGKNKFSGQYLFGVGITGAPDAGTFATRTDGVVTVAEVKPGRTYYISKGTSDLFRIAGSATYPKIGDVLTNFKHTTTVTDSMTEYTFAMGPDEKYLILYLSVTNTIPSFVQIEEGSTKTTYEAPKGAIPFDLIAEHKDYRPTGYLFADKDAFIINLDTQTITTVVNGGNYVLVGDKTYYFKAGTWDFSGVTGSSVIVLFDMSSLSFEFADFETISDVLKSGKAILGFIRRNPKQVYINGFYNDQTNYGISSSQNVYLIGDNGEDYTATTDAYTNAITSNFDFAQIYSGYDELVTAEPNYVTKSLLGNSHNSNPIYRYDFKPPQVESVVAQTRKIPKIILTVTLHGHEKHVARGALSFLRDLALRWQDQRALRFLRANAHLVVVPIVNPDGYNTEGLTPDGSGLAGRKNGNGVDLNRNFGPNWGAEGSTDPDNWMYMGPSEASEVETQMLMSLLATEPDIMHVVDYHNYGDFSAYNDVYYVTTDNAEFQKLWLAQGQFYDMKLRQDFSFLTNEAESLAKVRPQFTNSWAEYAESEGVNTILVESIVSKSGVSNSDMYRLNADVIGNVLLTIIRQTGTYLN